MKLHHVTTDQELRNSLINIYCWQSEIYENAESALSRAKGLADFLAHAACYVPKGDAIYPESLVALAKSISNDIQAVQLMLNALNRLEVVTESQA